MSDETERNAVDGGQGGEVNNETNSTERRQLKVKTCAGGEDKEMSITGVPILKRNVKLKHMQLLLPVQ